MRLTLLVGILLLGLVAAAPKKQSEEPPVDVPKSDGPEGAAPSVDSEENGAKNNSTSGEEKNGGESKEESAESPDNEKSSKEESKEKDQQGESAEGDEKEF